MTNYGNFKPVGKDGIGSEPNTSDPFLPGLWIEHEKRIADFLEGYKRGIKGWGVIENSSGTSLKVLNHSNTSDCSVDVQPGICVIDNSIFKEDSIVNVSLAQANGSLNRWDLIVYNASASAPVARIGTASVIPTIPDMESDDIPLGLVKRLAGNDTIEAGDIEDVRVMISNISSQYNIARYFTPQANVSPGGSWTTSPANLEYTCWEIPYLFAGRGSHAYNQDPVYIDLDLESEYYVKTTRWAFTTWADDSNDYHHELKYSLDNTNWSSLDSITTTNTTEGSTIVLQGDNFSARYIRLELNKTTSGNGHIRMKQISVVI
ncbi:hypothetical protein DRO35_04600 [Candidatus Bathyarchaeota archaeon]|mgnify:CR=1 FL=1|nr:MAG: hypothetical protein DRO35_04600 [Candidatus Bathyarchaeota archaeon]